jgi:hypothetical protein
VFREAPPQKLQEDFLELRFEAKQTNQKCGASFLHQYFA